MAQLLSSYGIKITGGNYTTMRRYIKVYNIDISHWGKTIKERQGWLKGKTHNWAPKIPLEKILVENSTYASFTCLRHRLLKEGLFEKKCYRCGITKWLDQEVPLELEHINGNKFDNRKENLTFLCCNCHALTSTYAGRNRGKYGGREAIRTHIG